MSLVDTARRVFGADRYATQQTGVTIDTVDLHTTCCSLTVEPHHRNAKGVVMGGVLMTLADYAFAVASHTEMLQNLGDDDEATLEWVTSSSQIHFLAPATQGRIVARTQCLKQGRRQCLYQITITDDTQRTLALVTASGTNIRH